ncbi:MAG: hypothetical protein V4633_11240, partial [Pseudomonadota bacterium]
MRPMKTCARGAGWAGTAAGGSVKSCAALPLKIYLKPSGGTGRTQRYYGPSLFDKPSASGTIFDWLFTAMT